MERTETRHTAVLHDWIDRHRQGSAEARDAIIEHTCDRLRRLARQMLRGYPRVQRWAQTDDVLQGALIRLHRSLAVVQPESVRHFYSLASTQIRRELIDLARHLDGPESHAAHHHTDGGAAVERRTDERGQPESLDAWAAFHERASQLPQAEHEVFALLWYEGLTQHEAADLLGVSLATLKRRWQSARILLQGSKDGSPESRPDAGHDDRRPDR